ncbi:hypothetical protein ACDX78_16705 [Virgibacillus oceani]
MKKIKDERLKLKNLQNIRIAYGIQTLGILGILGYDLITKGMDGMTDNPLWFVFMITVIVSLYLSMSISVENHRTKTSPKKGLIISLSVLIAICLIVGVLVTLTDGFGILNGLLIGGIFFICGFVPISYIYHLRKKAMDKNADE